MDYLLFYFSKHPPNLTTSLSPASHRRWKKREERRRKNLYALLYNRKSSTELLERILIEENLSVVRALAEVIPIGDGDDFGESMVVIFEANGMVMKLLKHFIHEEVQNSDDPATLFRGNCIASKIMKAYSKVEGSGEKRSGKKGRRRQGGRLKDWWNGRRDKRDWVSFV